QLVEGLIDSEREDLFMQIVDSLGLPASVVASTLTETITSLAREGAHVANLTDERLVEVFKALAGGGFSKEALPDVLRWLCSNPASTVEDAVRQLGLGTVSHEDVEAEVMKMVVSSRLDLNDPRLANRLMGDLMKKYRGRIDGKQLHSIVIRAIERVKSSGNL
ncbi:MAG: hypothetical protein QXY50_01320, partial [Candidatus Caldarchaeum sp.]